jgi:hypothetical protein
METTYGLDIITLSFEALVLWDNMNRLLGKRLLVVGQGPSSRLGQGTP